nr:complement receptor type 1-like isoform X1 [Misgurnus anguillicaudatus]XP_055043698.1 complement receptor type 1-like isoform X1 [Misgurnus anguillicaudatus]
MGCKVWYHVVALFLFLAKSVHVSAQCTQPAVKDNMKLLDEYILTTSFSDGAQVKYECMPGYVSVNPRASRYITCQGIKWTELALECKRKSCGSPPDLPNGRYEIPQGVLFGDTVIGVCNEGYELTSRISQRTCRSDGWDGRAPECEAVICLSPPIIDNGRIDDPPDTQYEYGMAVSYRCNDGLTLIGNSTLHCSQDGSFSPEPPKCITVSCEKPDVKNGYRYAGKSPPYTMNNFIDFKCDVGYEMKGDSHIVCTEKGWIPEPPQCIVYCGPPTFEGHVTISKTHDSTNKFLDGNNVTFECKSGYEAIDSKASKIVTCVDTKWTNLELKCKGFCGPPVFGENVNTATKLDSKKFPDGYTVEFECKSGYKAADLEASKFVTCMDTKWTDLKLKCEDETPPPPHFNKVLVAVLVGLLVLAVILCVVWYCCKKRNSKHEKVPTGSGEEDL